ncbi:hypothetical protein P7K49_026213 [Saguinus oedipus]|uniref:Uncharacterized protein n=1 Tax=Saguinus oedipus TaxID=9490 RepID=A0ABQ9UCL4_SAGOE|nr:hypothetical protein P7K49_026213 [Saguinus oedipus]
MAKHVQKPAARNTLTDQAHLPSMTSERTARLTTKLDLQSQLDMGSGPRCECRRKDLPSLSREQVGTHKGKARSHSGGGTRKKAHLTEASHTYKSGSMHTQAMFLSLYPPSVFLYSDKCKDMELIKASDHFLISGQIDDSSVAPGAVPGGV